METSAAVASTSSRSEKSELLANALRSLDEAEIEPAIGFLIGELRQGRIGVGWSTVADLNEVFATEPSLDVLEVDAAVDALEAVKGSGSQVARKDLLAALMVRATAEEANFIGRLFGGGIRQGASRGVLTDAVAKASGVKLKVVRRGAMLSGDLGRTALIALTSGEAGVDAIGLSVMNPILPMLASTAPDVGAAVESIGAEASVEWKLDGIRIQVHKSGAGVRIFTRNLNDVTERLGDVVELVADYEVESFVLDGEVVGEDAATFQNVASRFGTEVVEGPRRLVPRFFDIVHLDGTDLIDEPLRKRRAILKSIVGDDVVPGQFTADGAEAEKVLADSLQMGHEGVMVKASASIYEAGRRGKSWLKVKPVITLDLIVIGAEWGHGRRTGWLSNLHLGARDAAGGDAVMVGKTFKGLTDALLTWQTEQFLSRELRTESTTVFVKQDMVVEVAIDGVQSSTRYPGGVALRFARVRRYRDDKAAGDADTIESVRALLD